MLPESLRSSASGFHRRPPELAAPTPKAQRFRVYVPLSIAAVSVDIRSPENRHLAWLDAVAVRRGPHLHEYHVEVPEKFVAERALLRFVLQDLHGTTVRALPADAPLIASNVPLWLHQGQFFLSEPTSITVSPPHTESFKWAPKADFPERRVRVLLPRGYHENKRKYYPVLYAQDGQNLFHPGSQFGSWDMDLTVSRLIARAEIPELIVVAIDNTEMRFEEYTPSYGVIRGVHGMAEKYIAAMRDELVPIVNRRFRTRVEPEHTGHIGSSLGGLLGYYLANHAAEAFGIVAALSPSFWLNTEENVRQAKRRPEERARIWIDSGCMGPNSDGYHNTVRVRDAMEAAGESLGSHYMHLVALGHEHRERDWAQRLPDILRWMFPPREMPPAVAPQDENLVFLA